jgi:putative acetyltransferase
VDLVIAVDDPRAEDVRALLGAHLTHSRAYTPPAFRFALDGEGLMDPGVTFFSARRDGVLLGIGALKHLDDSHAELKSMHTRESARGQGVGRAIAEHLLSVAASRNYRRVSLETGSMDEYAPARVLYTKVGFTPCEPFGDYTASEYSTYMTIALKPRPEV